MVFNLKKYHILCQHKKNGNTLNGILGKIGAQKCLLSLRMTYVSSCPLVQVTAGRLFSEYTLCMAHRVNQHIL